MAAHSKPRGMASMLFALFLLLHVTAASISHRSRHAHAHQSSHPMEGHIMEARHMLEERANNIAITGVAGPGTVLSPRLEIRDLQKNADQWNLYLLGMERFKAKPKTDRLSYYQIAGIHGRPYVSWNNFPTPLLNNGGFCPHGMTMFGSWHRPYLAVYEQAWYQNVLEVIATFPANQQARWKAAARTLRMPFWDWARTPLSGQTNVPASIRDTTVTVTKPSGKVTISNPLYSYSFGSSLPAEMGGGPFGNSPVTLRRPIPNPPRSNNNEMNQRMNSLRISLRDRVYGLFMSGAAWGSVSTSAIGVRTQQNGNNPDSFESIHDIVHVTVGGDSGGHMYLLDYSAFDPVFWLHHTNIDRLLAMYQVISPNTYMANGNVNHPMAQWNVGEGKNSNSPLKPFTKNSNGDYFTSNDVKKTTVLGYVYPETSGAPTAASVKAAVAALYGTKGSNWKRSATGQYEGRPYKNGDYNTVLSVMANKFVMDGSYTVHCFIGDMKAGNSTGHGGYSANSTTPYSNSTGGADFTEHPNYVGAYGILGGSKGSTGNDTQVVTEGCIPLTTALQGKEATGELKSLHPDHVEPYLKENLHYKVIGPGGKELDADKITGFHIYAKSCSITPPATPEDLPSLGEYKPIPKATDGKPAGKPFVYKPAPIDVYPPTPSADEHPGYSPPQPTGTIVFPRPEDEPGYCVSKQTIQYVDESGKFLYSETT